MTDDGWWMVKAIPTTNADGKPINIYVGMLNSEPAIRIDDGPIALIPLEAVGGDLLAAIRKMLQEWYERRGR
ncbi:hypothetical protein ACIOD2_32495 [Amycolatopsis sp. NPDC088138]|uniref:hypothetical protein n=1 Tax=Amycolatopsis sp. NPDC088138 TaxID=3363938 RepID=UPI00380ED75D